MDGNLCREHLETLLTEEGRALSELEKLLHREQQVLADQDLAAIEHTARVRQEQIGALARIEEQRRSLCTMHGRSADVVGLEDLLRWCDPSGSLMSKLRQCAQGAARCRDLNDRNGILVAARLKDVESRLAVLTGRASQPATYGPKGAAASRLPGRVLGAA